MLISFVVVIISQCVYIDIYKDHIVHHNYVQFLFVNYKLIKLEKIIVSLYTSNEWSKNETEKIIPFTVTSKWVQCLGINSLNVVQNLYSENY